MGTLDTELGMEKGCYRICKIALQEKMCSKSKAQPTPGFDGVACISVPSSSRVVGLHDFDADKKAGLFVEYRVWRA